MKKLEPTLGIGPNGSKDILFSIKPKSFCKIKLLQFFTFTDIFIDEKARF